MPSTSTLAGALAAIEARLTANWTTTAIVFDNQGFPATWPPVSGGALAPYVFVELDDTGADIIGFGTPGNQTVLDSGKARFHVMVPKDEGLARAREYAVSIGEIFRQQAFYNSEAGVQVRTRTPTIGREASVDDGSYVGMTCSVDYEFYHRA